MSVEDRIRRLCADIVACQDETRTVALTKELQAAIHERIETLRMNLGDLPALRDIDES
jgi:hypothetical protein